MSKCTAAIPIPSWHVFISSRIVSISPRRALKFFTEARPRTAACPRIFTACLAVAAERLQITPACPPFGTACPPVGAEGSQTVTVASQIAPACPSIRSACLPLDTKPFQMATACPFLDPACPHVGTDGFQIVAVSSNPDTEGGQSAAAGSQMLAASSHLATESFQRKANALQNTMATGLFDRINTIHPIHSVCAASYSENSVNSVVPQTAWSLSGNQPSTHRTISRFAESFCGLHSQHHLVPAQKAWRPRRVEITIHRQTRAAQFLLRQPVPQPRQRLGFIS